MVHNVEVFTADCPLCLDTMKLVKEATKDCGCEIREYRCSGIECCDEAKQYEIKAVPSIVVDGKLVHVGKPTLEEFRKHIK